MSTGKIQKQDVKTKADLDALSVSRSNLINDNQIWIAANSINKTLDEAITGGNIVTSAVTSLHADSNSNLTGAVRLVSGSNITLSQSGQDITIAGSAGASSFSPFSRVVANPSITGSTDTTIGSAITAASAGDSIYITAGTYTETVTVSKRLNIYGAGLGTVINGTTTIQSAASGSLVTELKFADNVTIDSGSVANFITNCFISTGKDITDSNSTKNQNMVLAIKL